GDGDAAAFGARRQVHRELAVEEAAQRDRVALARDVDVEVHAAHLAGDAARTRGQVEWLACIVGGRGGAPGTGDREQGGEPRGAHASIISLALRSSAPEGSTVFPANGAR